MRTDRLNTIYGKTHGCCHLCHKKLAFINYGVRGAKGAWHIEHSVPKAKGGTDHLNNLYPACISCNLEKGTQHSRTIRTRYGTTRAPYSQSKKAQLKQDNAFGLAAVGLILGGIIGGPGTAILGILIGSEVGKSISPKR